MTVSPPVRILAICGLVGAVVIGGGLMLLGRHGSGTAAAPVTIKHHPFGPGIHTHHRTALPNLHSSTAVKHSAPAVKVREAERPVASAAALAAGLPISLARALTQHQVVVVQIYDPQAEVDAIAYAEAQAGAREAGVGFVPLSVLGKGVDKLTQRFGQVLADPGILVYSRPAKLSIRIDGFVDKDTVAQAAENAAPSPLAASTATAARTSWSAAADTTCASAFAKVPQIHTDASQQQAAAWAPRVLVAEQRQLAGLRALPLPTNLATRTLVQKYLTNYAEYTQIEAQLTTLLRRNHFAAARKLALTKRPYALTANRLAHQLHAPACANLGV